MDGACRTVLVTVLRALASLAPRCLPQTTDFACPKQNLGVADVRGGAGSIGGLEEAMRLIDCIADGAAGASIRREASGPRGESGGGWAGLLAQVNPYPHPSIPNLALNPQNL